MWPLNSVVRVLVRDIQRGGTGRRGEGHVEMEQTLELYCHKARNTWSHQKLDQKARIPPRAFGRHTFLPTPWFQNSGLQNCDKMKFPLVKPPSLWLLYSPRKLTYLRNLHQNHLRKVISEIRKKKIRRLMIVSSKLVSTPQDPTCLVHGTPSVATSSPYAFQQPILLPSHGYCPTPATLQSLHFQINLD